MGSDGTVIVADPSTTGAVPRTVEPSVNVTGPDTPVGTGSVMVTGEPAIGAVGLTIGGTRTGVDFTTVTGVAGEVAALLLLSAGVLAVMGSVPIGRLVIVMVAVPLTIGAVPMTVPPLEKVTGPVTPGGTVSVMVSEPPTGIVGEETVGGGRFGVPLLTTCVSGAEVPALLFASPGKLAVMVCEPAVRVLVV
jgi:hypothetical protein